MCTFNLCLSPAQEVFSHYFFKHVLPVLSHFSFWIPVTLMTTCVYCSMFSRDSVRASELTCLHKNIDSCLSHLLQSFCRSHSAAVILLPSPSTLNVYFTCSWISTWFLLISALLYWICTFQVSASINNCLKILSYILHWLRIAAASALRQPRDRSLQSCKSQNHSTSSIVRNPLNQEDFCHTVPEPCCICFEL